MDNLDKNIKGEKNSRILWVDPNLSNNKMVNPDDLTIKVEFSTTRKPRSIIFSGQEINNTAGSQASVTFIEGSKISNSDLPSLTTRYTDSVRYTDAIQLEIMNVNNDNVDDFESLGIESIDIEFNTAFQPIIKINFVDVRGQAILEQGGMSKYRMFFELPYPIYNLKIKGFYGKTVSYCLHMQRWNASFNSDTGNFEIQADFLGYTYAALTDMLFGLIRAAVKTEKGQQILQNKIAEYGQNSDLVLTIDDMLKRLITLNFGIKKVANETGEAAELQSYDKVYDIIDKMNVALDNLMNSLESPYFIDSNKYYVCAPKSSEAKFKTALDEYNDIIDKLVDDINLNLDDFLKFDKSAVKKIVKINNISKDKLTGPTIKDDIRNNGYYYPGLTRRYNDDNESNSNMDNMLKVIGGLNTVQISKDIEFDIYNFKFIRYDINVTKRGQLEKRQKQTEVSLNEDLSNTAISILGFEPTIRNIFRILSINTEIFLEVLRTVSSEAQVNDDRKNEFVKLINPTTASFNVQEKDLNNRDIWPWPEYRAKNTNNPNDGFIETWLGSASGINSDKINEVVFTNEMHQKLIDVAKFDNDLDNLIDDLEAGLDIDKPPFIVENPWFPVSVADTPIDPRMVQNPYLTALEEERTVESVQRLLLMRTFLLLGVSTLNGKIDDDILNFMGKAEAENFLAACRKLGPEGQTILNLYLNGDDKIETYFGRIIGGIGLNGSDKIKNPLKEKKRPIMVRVRENGDPEPNRPTDFTKVYYKYTYIIDNKTKASYIPVNKGFSGIDFYNPTSQTVTLQGNSLLPTIEVSSNFKTNNQLKELSNDILFVSNPINWKSSDGNVTKFYKEDDGSLHVKLYDISEYESKGMIPSSEVYDENLRVIEENKQTDPTRNVLNVDNYYISVITNNNDTLGMYESLKDPTLLIKGFQPYNSQYTSPEFKELNYNSNGGKYGNYIGEPKWGGGVNHDSSLLAFYTQNSDRDATFPNYGTYLVKVGKIDPKIISTVNPSTIFSETLGNQFINNQNVTLFSYRAFMGSGGVVAGSPRGFWVDNLGYNLQNKNLLSLKIKNTLDVYLPFIEYGAEKTWGETMGTYNISLFGSYHYYSQISNEVKALLFLHTIPWQGVKTFAQDINEFLMFDKRVDWKKFEAGSSLGPKKTRVLSVKTLFQVHGGFIHAPKAWVLFIGGMLWRLNLNQDPIFYNNKNKTIIDPTYKPNKEQYMYYCAEDGFDDSPDRKPWGLYYGNVEYDKNNIIDDNYVPIDKTLRFLPKQVRDEFINYFTNWVNSQDGFIAIQNELELFKNVNQLDLAFDDLINKVSKTEVDNRTTNKISLNAIYQHIDKNIVDNYDLIAPSEGGLRYNFTTILKPNTSVMNSIVSLLVTPTVIQNVNPNIWNYNPYNEYDSGAINDKLGKRFGYEGKIGSTVSPSKAIRVRGDKMRTFIDSFHTQLISKKEDFLKEKALTEDDITNIRLFGTSDDKSIKLQIYRTLSSINDKWLNGTKDSNIFTQCGGGGVNESHLEHSKKYRTNSDNTVSLIDTFRFVDRTFKDIGDKFFIDINKVTNLIKGQYNVSFFDIANQILSDNNFNFIPLPNFINFNEPKHLEEIFRPYSYNDEVTFDGTGPAFICCYVGQTSTNLDLGLNSAYPDDGFSINRGENLPDDFNGIPDARNGDMYAPVFAVNYGQQNQNYFKNVKLDQREFAETMESLEIIEALSQTGDKSKATFAGNNLFNVYKTRSYSAEVEMMGSAMIQPMMYFQLNNIPMFRGAYLIYKVNHKITPHNMVTRFKGNRVKKTKTPLLDEATMYMNLVGTQSGGRIGGSNRLPKTVLPIVKTLIDNGITNGTSKSTTVSGYITHKKVNLSQTRFVNNGGDNGFLITEAANSLEKMLLELTKHLDDIKHPRDDKGKFGYIGSFYRTLAGQNSLASNPMAAPAGTSLHGWGIAIDWNWTTKDGKLYNRNYNVSTKPSEFNFNDNPVVKWLFNNSYRFGFINPDWAHDGTGKEEIWHWEYHGKSAKYCISKNSVHGQEFDVSKEYDTIVKNPRKPDGSEDDYGTKCNYIKINRGDGSDNNNISLSEVEARKEMKVSNLKPGFDVEFKTIITNGNYSGINITDYTNDWISVAANYIAKKETFKASPKNDQGTLRAGYGTDKILENGTLNKVTSNTVFTEQIAKNTLVYQIKNSFAKPVEDALGTNNWNKLNKYQKTALISLTYNTGPNIFSQGYGKKIKDNIESNNFEEAAQGILDGPISGKVSGYMEGLKKRRIEEARLFLLKKDYTVTYTT